MGRAAIRAKRAAMAPLRPAQWAALAVALLGIAVSLAPAARSSVAACP